MPFGFRYLAREMQIMTVEDNLNLGLQFSRDHRTRKLCLFNEVVVIQQIIRQQASRRSFLSKWCFPPEIPIICLNYVTERSRTAVFPAISRSLTAKCVISA